jgi:hypothetical protein
MTGILSNISSVNLNINVYNVHHDRYAFFSLQEILKQPRELYFIPTVLPWMIAMTKLSEAVRLKILPVCVNSRLCLRSFILSGSWLQIVKFREMNGLVVT